MKSKTLQKVFAIFLVLGMLISYLPTSVSAQGATPNGPSRPVVERSTLLDQPEPESPQIEVISPYFSVQYLTMPDGTQISRETINGPSAPLPEYQE